MALVAALLSAFCPGLGQIYNGQAFIGGFIMLVASVAATAIVLSGFSAESLLSGTSVAFYLIYVAGIVQAYMSEKA